MRLNTRIALGLAMFALLDAVLPIPVTALFLVFVLLARPPYFKAWVDRLYSESTSS